MNRTQYGDIGFAFTTIRCPNADCNELVLTGELCRSRNVHGNMARSTAIQTWKLLPESNAKVLPNYVPEAIREDYKEACRIRDLSPKASATLARRAIQGMIRDFWNVRGRTLREEIDGIEDLVDPDTWTSIDAVRSVGNIGAHMENDVNVIVPIDPEETQLLIELVETLVEDWYVDRNNKQERNQKIAALAAEKQAARQNPPPAE